MITYPKTMIALAMTALAALVFKGCGPPNEMPTVGRDWKVPQVGMEFVWVEQMNIWVGKYEVTNGEYRRKEPCHDSGWYTNPVHSLNGDRQPVVKVNWSDAVAYAAWLTERERTAGRLPEGLRYRLPTEEEFMAFAQCGDGREYPWGSDWPPRSGQAGNYADATVKRAFPGWTVIGGYDDGHKLTSDVQLGWANPWGLYGVGGNVSECCAIDTDTKQSFGAWRDASWESYREEHLHCAFRYDDGECKSSNQRGFRLVLSDATVCFGKEATSDSCIGFWITLVRGTADASGEGVPEHVARTSIVEDREEWDAMPKVWLRFWRMTADGELVPRPVTSITPVGLRADTGGEGLVRRFNFEVRSTSFQPAIAETIVGLVPERYYGTGRRLLVAGRKYKFGFTGIDTHSFTWGQVGFPLLPERGEVMQCNFVFYEKDSPFLSGGRLGPGSAKVPRRFVFIHHPFTADETGGRAPYSWARYYRRAESGEHWITDAWFGEKVAFEVGPVELGGTLLVGETFGGPPRYVIRNVTDPNVVPMFDATNTFAPEDAVEVVFHLPESLGDLRRLRWVKLRLDPGDIFAAREFFSTSAMQSGVRLIPDRRKLEWTVWPGRYRMEVEVDPESPVAGQPYAWDLGWVAIQPRPAENVIRRLPEGEVLRTIRRAAEAADQPISDKDAIAIASRKIAEFNMPFDREAGPTVQRSEAGIVVTFPRPPRPPGWRGGDFVAKVTIDPKSGEILEILFGR